MTRRPPMTPKRSAAALKYYKVSKPKPMGETQWNVRLNGDCNLCGGVHYGSGLTCPYQCTICGVNTNPCDKENCGRKK